MADGTVVVRGAGTAKQRIPIERSGIARGLLEKHPVLLQPVIVRGKRASIGLEQTRRRLRTRAG